MFSVYSYLDGKTPEKAKLLLDEIGAICKGLLREIEAFPANIDSQSAASAAGQIRSYASNWKTETARIGIFIKDIKHLNIQMENESMDKYLNETLSHSWQNFSKTVDYLMTIQPQDLKAKHF